MQKNIVLSPPQPQLLLTSIFFNPIYPHSVRVCTYMKSYHTETFCILLLSFNKKFWWYFHINTCKLNFIILNSCILFFKRPNHNFLNQFFVCGNLNCFCYFALQTNILYILYICLGICFCYILVKELLGQRLCT